MNAIFINANEQKVEAIEIENDIHAFYNKIGCQIIEVINLRNNFLLIFDEEAHLRNVQTGFNLQGFPVTILGNGILVREDKFSNFIGCNLPPEVVKNSLQFI